MSKVIYIKQLPKNSDEEYLIRIGEVKPTIIMIQDDPDKENQFKYTIPSNKGNADDKLQIWKDFTATHWVEYDIFTGQEGSSYFICSALVTYSDIYFRLDEEYKQPSRFHREVFQDEISVRNILSDGSTTIKEKADNLLTLLLDRQMYLNDSDEFTADQAYYIYNTAEYADFFDKVINIIKELDPIIWKVNESQVTLPTLQDFL